MMLLTSAPRDTKKQEISQENVVFRQDKSNSTINSESLWAMFIIAMKFACGHSKATAIIKGAISQFYHKKAIHNFSNVLIDESNDKVDKSCIILVMVLDCT